MTDFNLFKQALETYNAQNDQNEHDERDEHSEHSDDHDPEEREEQDPEEHSEECDEQSEPEEITKNKLSKSSKRGPRKKLVEEKNVCEHENTVTERGICICIDCGEEIQLAIAHDKEWRFYGNSDNKHSSDPNRVQMRKSEDRNIFKDVENLGFTENIISKANKLYSQVTCGKIFRGNSRKAIVFACIFHAFKLVGKPQSHDKLMGIFGLDRKTGLRGLKYVNLYAPKGSNIRTTYITPINLVSEIMQHFSASKEQIDEVLALYDRIKNRSSRLNRSRPLSVTSALVFYWICLKGKEIGIKDFAKNVKLSSLTIKKLAKEIECVLKTPGIIPK